MTVTPQSTPPGPQADSRRRRSETIEGDGDENCIMNHIEILEHRLALAARKDLRLSLAELCNDRRTWVYRAPTCIKAYARTHMTFFTPGQRIESVDERLHSKTLAIRWTGRKGRRATQADNGNKATVAHGFYCSRLTDRA